MNVFRSTVAIAFIGLLSLPGPAGQESNWLATVPGKGFFAVLRLYGATEAAMDRSWKPGDVEKTN